MTGKLPDWIAGVYEYRLALIVAGSGSLMLIVLVLISSWLISDSSTTEKQAKHVTMPAFHLPPRPGRSPASRATTDSVPPATLPGAQRVENAGTAAVARKRTVITPARRPEANTPADRMKAGQKLPPGFYVQAGAFKSAALAGKLADKLKHAGWQVHGLFKRNGLRAVLVGPSPDRKLAEDSRKRLAATVRIKGFIIRIARKPG